MDKSLRPLINLTGQSFAYGMGIYGRQIIVYLTLPLFTSLLTQEEYGIVSLVLSFYTVINTLTNAGLPSATFRLYNDRDDLLYKRQTLGSSQALFFLISAAASALILVFAKPISTVILGNPLYFDVVRITALLLVVDTLNNYGNILLRLQVKPIKASVQSLVYIFTQIGSALLLIYYFQLGVMGYWFGYLIGAVVGLVLMIWLNWGFISFEISFSQIKELLGYGLPLVPATFSINLIRLTDNFLIRSFISVDQVAVYAIGYKIGSLVNMLLGPFNVAWPNFAFTMMHQPNAKRAYRDVFTFLFAGSSFISLGVFFFRVWLIKLVAPLSYLPASRVVIWIGMAMVAFGVYPVLSLGPKIKKQTYKLAWISVVTSIVNIILSLVLIPPLGITGVALSTFISYFLLASVSYLISQNLYKIPLDWIRLGKVMLSLLVTALIVELTFPTGQDPWVYFISRMLGVALFPALLFVMRFASVSDLRSAAVVARDRFLELIK